MRARRVQPARSLLYDALVEANRCRLVCVRFYPRRGGARTPFACLTFLRRDDLLCINIFVRYEQSYFVFVVVSRVFRPKTSHDDHENIIFFGRYSGHCREKRDRGLKICHGE